MMDEDNPYEIGAESSKKQLFKNRMYFLFDIPLFLMGIVSVVYCLAIMAWPGMLEEHAVTFIAWWNSKPPQSGDYRYAWKLFELAVVVASVFAIRFFYLIFTRSPEFPL
jgi:hypothetical protein